MNIFARDLLYVTVVPAIIVAGYWAFIVRVLKPKCQHEWVAALHDDYPFVGEVTLIICRKCEKKRTMKSHYWEALNRD